jgi:hypothetical protein
MNRKRILTKEGQFFVTSAAVLAFVAGVILGVAKGSLLMGVVGFACAFILQLAGKELARSAMAKTGTQAPEDYHSASLQGWLTSILVGALIIWGIVELF